MKIENRKIKKYFNKLSCDTKKILVAILEDSLVYLDNQKLINNQVLNRVVSIYFLLIDYDYKNMVEFDDLNIKEKKLIYKIVLDGVASMYVDNEYLQFSDVGTKYKRKIIQELLSFFKYISKFSKEKVFMLYEIEVQKYRRKGFNWDNIPY